MYETFQAMNAFKNEREQAINAMKFEQATNA